MSLLSGSSAAQSYEDSPQVFKVTASQCPFKAGKSVHQSGFVVHQPDIHGCERLEAENKEHEIYYGVLRVTTGDLARGVALLTSPQTAASSFLGLPVITSTNQAPQVGETLYAKGYPLNLAGQQTVLELQFGGLDELNRLLPVEKAIRDVFQDRASPKIDTVILKFDAGALVSGHSGSSIFNQWSAW